MYIIGAGLAGLLAGSIFQRARIFEAGPEEQVSHKAVLRFRSSSVGEAVGIDFKPVTVHKNVWHEGRFVQPDIQVANLYSQKVIGHLADRSVWSIAPAQRFIAPENLVEQLAERCAGRVHWNTSINSDDFVRRGANDEATISTAPMPVLFKLLGRQGTFADEFKYQPIVVRRWRVPNADVYQTIYFTERFTNLYRASITGSLLIAEYMHEADPQFDNKVFEAFGLSNEPEPIDNVRQRFGKIAPVDEQARRQFILSATLQNGIYSLGRFATWRNILLDDVLHDISVIKKLISGGAYAATRSV